MRYRDQGKLTGNAMFFFTISPLLSVSLYD